MGKSRVGPAQPIAIKKSKKAKGGKKGRKIGRNKLWCERYRREGREERNRKKKLERHLKRFPNDQMARLVLEAGA